MTLEPLHPVCRLLMLRADELYCAKAPMPGGGYILHDKDATLYCSLIEPASPVDSMQRLRQFASTVQNTVQRVQGVEAGIMCRMSVSLDNGAPEDMVVLYIDQKYTSGTRMLFAPLRGEHLEFRDMGLAPPKHEVFPPLFVAELYGAMIAEA